MTGTPLNPLLIRAAWQGRISGCILGKPVEVLSFQQGSDGIEGYLRAANALPLRDYVPLIEGTMVDRLGRNCCGRCRTRMAELTPSWRHLDRRTRRIPNLVDANGCRVRQRRPTRL